MTRGLGIALLLCAVAVGQGGLSGEISGGKARKLVDQALPLLKKADATFKDWVLEKIPAAELKERLAAAVKQYDQGTALLQRALDIQYDAGVNHRSKIAARRLQKMRYTLEFQLKPRPKPKPRPAPEGSPPVKPPEPEPEPAPKPPSRDLEEDARPVAAVTFEANEPPGKPRDVKLAPIPGVGSTPELQKIAKIDKRLIKNAIRDYYGALRQNKLRQRHRLCRGKGVLGDEACEECRGTGEGINLHHFRKAYWMTYTPLLRDAEGALAALEKFYERARRDPTVLHDPVKTHKVLSIDYQGLWARVEVMVKTKKGERTEAMTLISIGSSWYFYQPECDAELLPEDVRK